MAWRTITSMRGKMFRQPRAKCLKLFLFLTGSVIIVLWNYENPQGLSGQSTKHKESQGAFPIAPQPKAAEDTPSPPPERAKPTERPMTPAPPPLLKGEPPVIIKTPVPPPIAKIQSPVVNKTPKPPPIAKTQPPVVAEQTKAVVNAQKTGLVAGESSFYMDGKPIRLLSGSFHYFRTHPTQWLDRIHKMKAAGLNTVNTYIPWNLHEPRQGQYEFDGFFSIAKFIKQVQAEGMYLIVRPGPYICAEWELGGFPYWLLRDPSMQFRTSQYKPYLAAVEKYLNKLLPLFVPHMYKNGGPIIAFQIENEFGSWTTKGDQPYLKFLHELFIRNGLDKELLFTSDGSPHLRKGQIPGVLTTINFNNEPLKKLKVLKKLQPHKPLMVMEFWPGWFDRLGEPHHKMAVDDLKTKVQAVLSLNASINFYMFAGGTHFDFWNGASNISGNYGPITTSYDYDAPISESGDLTQKYYMLKKLFASYKLVPENLPAVPKDSPKEAYGVVKMTEILRYDEFLPLMPAAVQTYKYPRNMENLNSDGQAFGWLMYRTMVWKSKDQLVFSSPVMDRASVIVNSKLVDTLGWKSGMHPVKMPSSMKRKGNTLDILVENMGRVNWDHSINVQRKGLFGNVTYGKSVLREWKHISYDFCDLFKKNLTATKLWKPHKTEFKQTAPSAYRGHLEVKTAPPRDTFLNMAGWERGLVLVNGFNVGRYWKGGPQRTLYVPAPLLRKDKNEVIVFELHSSPGQVEFQAKLLLSLESQKDKFDKN